MWVTLNQIEAESRKAAYGAGYSWSLAEQAGHTARWLAMRGLPWLRPLTAGVLRQISRLESIESAQLVGTVYGPTAAERCLGPVSAVAALADDAIALGADGAELSFRRLAAPVLLLPTLAMLSKRTAATLLVRWPGAIVECRAGEAWPERGATLGLGAVLADWITICRLRPDRSTLALAPSLRHHGSEADDALWRELDTYANRGYVRETDTARLFGGASLTDND